MQHTNNNNDRLTQAVSSDYFRRQQQKRRLAYDICLFFLAGVLFLLLAEIFIGG